MLQLPVIYETGQISALLSRHSATFIYAVSVKLFLVKMHLVHPVEEQKSIAS